jgi:hypothetical protein
VKLFFKSKDGGPESNVTGYWLIESKSLFSIVLLRFSGGTREAYHNHAFNAVSWILSGCLFEEHLINHYMIPLFPSIKPIYTSRDCFHKVHGMAKVSWALSFRGPWKKYWNEYTKTGFTTLTNGRKIVNGNSNY